MRSGLLAGIRWSVCMLKSHRKLWESFSRTGTGLCIYRLFLWLNLNFLHISLWITLPTQSCLALYSFYANLLYSLIMWLIVSSLSPHSLHLLFCCVLSILALIWFVLMALSCAAIRRDSVSLLRFSFLRISFRCFGMFYFVCTVLPFDDISLILLLWPVFSGLFPQVVLLFYPMRPVPSSPRLFQRLSSSFGLVFVFTHQSFSHQR